MVLFEGHPKNAKTADVCVLFDLSVAVIFWNQATGGGGGAPGGGGGGVTPM